MKKSNLHSNIELIKLMVENRADIGSFAQRTGDTALHLQCKKKKISIDSIRCLIENKSTMNVRNIEFLTPLHCACLNEQTNLELIKLLVESNACIYTPKENQLFLPIHLLAQSVNPKLDVFDYFLSLGCSINLIDSFFNTSFHYICSKFSNLVKFFIDNKTDLNFKNKNGETPLMRLCKTKQFNLNFHLIIFRFSSLSIRFNKATHRK